MELELKESEQVHFFPTLLMTLWLRCKGKPDSWRRKQNWKNKPIAIIVTMHCGWCSQFFYCCPTIWTCKQSQIAVFSSRSSHCVLLIKTLTPSLLHLKDHHGTLVHMFVFTQICLVAGKITPEATVYKPSLWQEPPFFWLHPLTPLQQSLIALGKLLLRIVLQALTWLIIQNLPLVSFTWPMQIIMTLWS